MSYRPARTAALFVFTFFAPAVASAEETATPAPPAALTAPTSQSEGPLVNLDADDGRATLERRLSTTSPTVPLAETGVVSIGTWQHACVMPCERRLDPQYVYRVAGDGLVPSGSFALPREGDRVRVDARMGSSTTRTLGAFATAGGVLAILGGGLAVGATPILESENVGSEGFRTAVLAGGIGALSVGVLGAALGAYLWLSNGSTAHASRAAETAIVGSAR